MKKLLIIILVALAIFKINEGKKNKEIDISSTAFACEEFTNLPFEINGVELISSKAILQTEYSEAYAQITLKGKPEKLILKLKNYMFHVEDSKNLSIKIKVFLEDGTSKEHNTFKETGLAEALVFGFPKEVKNIVIVSSTPMAYHEFFGEDNRTMINSIYINFD